MDTLHWCSAFQPWGTRGIILWATSCTSNSLQTSHPWCGNVSTGNPHCWRGNQVRRPCWIEQKIAHDQYFALPCYNTYNTYMQGLIKVPKQWLGPATAGPFHWWWWSKLEDVACIYMYTHTHVCTKGINVTHIVITYIVCKNIYASYLQTYGPAFVEDFSCHICPWVSALHRCTLCRSKLCSCYHMRTCQHSRGNVLLPDVGPATKVLNDYINA